MITREEIIAGNPLVEFVQKTGIVLKKRGGEYFGLCPFHPDKNPSFRVSPTKNTWFCDPCGVGGSVIDFVMRREGLTPKDALERLSAQMPRHLKPTGKTEQARPSITAVYPYDDEYGKVLFEVCRLEPKSFRQRHEGPNGTVWNMEGVRRVLYRLPEVLRSEKVFIVEGEKDANTMADLGFCATCNVGGAKKWLESYSETLKGKTVVIIPDDDEAGKEHGEIVLKSVLPVAKEVFVWSLAQGKDMSDFVKKVGPEMAKEWVAMMFSTTTPVPRANAVNIVSMEDMERNYRIFHTETKKSVLHLGRWIPSLGKHVRGLVPGELVAILGDTGVGKTALLQGIAIAAAPLKVLLFEIELPDTLLFERFVQMEKGMEGDEVSSAYANGSSVNWKESPVLHHIYVCPQSKLNPVDMEAIINRAELKIGERPQVVMVDYIGLMNGPGNSRYERMSNIAEQMKVIAKATNTIVIIASQVGRKTDDRIEVKLHDGKDSGSVENSAGLVLGAWRDDKDKTLLNIQILKNTKGASGARIYCNFNGKTLQIRERSTKEDPMI